MKDLSKNVGGGRLKRREDGGSEELLVVLGISQNDLVIPNKQWVREERG